MVYIVLILFYLFRLYLAETETNETGIFSDLWNSLTSVEKSRSCPGECVHAITSIFCDNVLEEVTCGSTFLRCCVPHEFSYGTPVETSPPLTLNDTITAITTTTYHTDTATTNHEILSSRLSCDGKCVPTEYLKHCNNILMNSECLNTNQNCCLDTQISFEVNTHFDNNESSSLSAIVLTPTLTPTSTPISETTPTATSSTTSTTTTTAPFTTHSTYSIHSTATNMATTIDLTTCLGTCVAPLFSILCDRIDENSHCSNGGYCCYDKQQSENDNENDAKISIIGACFGNCIPIILSGVCNRPNQLILKTTNCSSGSICCSTPSFDTEIHSNASSFDTSPLIQHSYHDMHDMHGSKSTIVSIGGEQQPPSIPHVPYIPAVPQPQPQPIPIPIPIPSQSQLQSIHAVVACSGPCIAPMFRFTCFGGNAIYPKFQCAKAGQLCCSPLNHIQAFEANILANNGIWKQKPNVTLHNHENITVITSITPSPPTSYDDSPIKPLPKNPNPYMCGIKGTQRKETPRVVGGSDSYPGEWCWQAALINSQNQYLCGGALIGAQWVLTAAHCITNLVRNGDAIYVRVGDYDLTTQIGSRGAQTQRVTTTYIHHNHNGHTLDNDIALLKLQSPVELNEAVCLVCLPARGSERKPGKRCIVTGYGYKEEAGPIALKVREAIVPIVDDQECTVKINAVTEKLFILPASSFCSGGDLGNDACQGDGGGPLTCEADGYYELTGLVSWGFGCGRPNVPGVYVKVSSFVGWINQIISVNNQ